MNTAQKTLNVADFLERGFFQSLKKTPSERTKRNYRLALRHFEKFLGRPSTLADLDADNLAGFAKFREKADRSPDTVKWELVKLRSFWRCAAKKGLVDEPKRKPVALDGIDEWDLPTVVNDCLGPSGRYASGSLRKYRQACREFCAFRGGPQRAADVTFRLLDEFKAWLVADRGLAAHSARTMADMVATVVRCVDPTLLVRRYGVPRFVRGPRRRAFADCKIEGSVEWIMVNEYFPTKSRIADPKTEHQYAMCLSRFAKFLGRPVQLADLSDLTMGRWLRSMRDEGLAPQSANGYMNKLRAFWTWCAKRRLVELFPTIENLPEPGKIPKAWTRDQLAQLVQGICRSEGMIGAVRTADYWRAFYLVLWDTGERTGAMLGLRWECFDAAAASLEAPAEIRKGRKKPMLYQLKPATIDALQEIRQPPRKLIFGYAAAIAGKGFYLRHRELLTTAGLPYERRVSGPQKMRRTFASFLELLGGNATTALDHTSRRVTTQSYLDPRIARAEPENLRLFDLTAKNAS